MRNVSADIRHNLNIKPKHKRARGRIALSDVDLQPLGLGGGSLGSLDRIEGST